MLKECETFLNDFQVDYLNVTYFKCYIQEERVYKNLLLKKLKFYYNLNNFSFYYIRLFETLNYPSVNIQVFGPTNSNLCKK